MKRNLLVRTKKPATQKGKVAPTRIGELGEHKINIQLDQLPKECKHVSDLMIRNPKSSTGYSQIDHVVITPYGIFVIETKNYKGEIKGGKGDRQWTVSNRFKMYNPLRQNYSHIKALESILPSHRNPIFISMISFTMRCRFSIDLELRQIQSNELVVYDVELSEFINRKIVRMKAENSEGLINTPDILSIYETLKTENIIDPVIRNEHVARAKSKVIK